VIPLRLSSLLLVVALTGCSFLADRAADLALGGAGSGLSVDANAGQAKGEGNQSVAQNAATAVSGQVNDTTEFQGNVDKVVTNKGLAVHELLLLVLLAGWAIPGPAEMFRGIGRLFRRRSYSPPPRTVADTHWSMWR
jgi:hypothetical protein